MLILVMDVFHSATFKIKSPPISVNSAYYKRNKSYNETTRRWRCNFLKELQNDYNKSQIKIIKNNFRPKQHMLRVKFIWYQPLDKLITKSGHLSLKSMDVDNTLKIPTDCLFDKKYNNKWLSLRKGREAALYHDFKDLENLAINDKFIFDTRSIKMPSADNGYHCSILVEIVPLFLI